MTVKEVGIISNDGKPIIHTDLACSTDTSNEERHDPILMGGFLNAIQTFIKNTFAEEPSSFDMKKFSIYFYEVELLLNEKVTIYVISEKNKKNLKAINDKIKHIGIRLRETFPSVKDITSSVDKKEMFNNYIIEEFSDLCLKPEERARKLFG